MGGLKVANGECLILALDGGGAKGVFTLGVLEEIEARANVPLSQLFDLIYGTSSGAIIAALIRSGVAIAAIRKFYLNRIPEIMRGPFAAWRTEALRDAATEVLGDRSFDDLDGPTGVVAADPKRSKPVIFKSSATQAHGRRESFVPGFGASLVEGIVGSSAAVPFFKEAEVETSTLGTISVVDGGFVANNPTLYAVADAVGPMGFSRDRVRILNVGVGEYPVRRGWVSKLLQRLPSVELLERTLRINSASMTKLTSIVYSAIELIRVNGMTTGRENATSMLETDINRLTRMNQFGRDSYGGDEEEIAELLRI